MTTQLITRLERLSGPDREVDVEIALAIDWSHPSAMCSLRLLNATMTIAEIATEANQNGSSLLCDTPRYTASIDAAMMLVPEGDYDLDWLRSTRGRSEGFKLWQIRIALETVEQDRDETGPVALGEHDCPAIALCIASLKARNL